MSDDKRPHRILLIGSEHFGSTALYLGMKANADIMIVGEKPSTPRQLPIPALHVSDFEFKSGQERRRERRKNKKRKHGNS